MSAATLVAIRSRTAVSDVRPGLCGMGVGRCVAVLAVHHVCVGQHRYAGGAEKYLVMAVDALLESGAVVHVAYSGDSIYETLQCEWGGDALTLERTEWVDDKLSGDARLDVRTVLARRRWLRASRADTVFVVQQAGGGSFAASLVAAKSLGLRVVSSIRQLPIESAPTRRTIWRRRLVARCCDRLIFNSGRVAEAYQRVYGVGGRRARIIPNGERPRPGAACADRRPTTIGSVGRITEAKGVDTLFDAFVRLAPRHPDLRCVMHGDGPLIESLRDRAARIGLGDRVILPGYCAERDRLFADIDIYVQLSHRESMSNSVVEAMARGIPCVVSDVGGLPETVIEGECGFIVPAGDAQAAADALNRLLCEAPLYERFSEASLDRVRRHFDLDRVRLATVEAVLGLDA